METLMFSCFDKFKDVTYRTVRETKHRLAPLWHFLRVILAPYTNIYSSLLTHISLTFHVTARAYYSSVTRRHMAHHQKHFFLQCFDTVGWVI